MTQTSEFIIVNLSPRKHRSNEHEEKIVLPSSLSERIKLLRYTLVTVINYGIIISNFYRTME